MLPIRDQTGETCGWLSGIRLHDLTGRHVGFVLTAGHVYRGAVHGPETTLGHVADSDFRINPAEIFAQDELASVYAAARAVLIHALTRPVTGRAV